MWETILYSLGSTLLGGLTGWFFGRKKQKIDEINAATDTFNKIIESLESKIDNFLAQQKLDSCKIAELTKEVGFLREEIEQIKGNRVENIKLKKKIEKYEKLLTDNNIVY